VLSVFEHWDIGAAALFGGALILMGIWIRSGGYRRGVARIYFRRVLPDYQRNAIFALIPMGAAFVLLIGGATLGNSRGGPEADDPGAMLLVGLGLFALVFGLACIVRPPRFMKPAWVVEREHAERAGAPVEDFTPRPMSPRAYTINWIGLAALAGAWLAVGLPLGPLLIGVGTGAALLLASWPRQA
jgi:hypothetical protein